MATCTRHVNFYSQHLRYEPIVGYLASGAQISRHREPSTYRATFDRTFHRPHPIRIIAGQYRARSSVR
jgi:hypothetical protein